MLDHLKVLKSIWLHPSNQSNQINAIFRAAKYWFSPYKSKRPVYVSAFGFSMKLYPDAAFTRTYIYYTAYKDHECMQFIERYLRSGEAFIDIGANIGVYTLLAASLVGESGTVDSFEPVPSTFLRLQENINLNKINFVTLHNLAVGENTSKLIFTSNLDETNHCLLSNDPIALSMNNVIEVPSHRLDESLLPIKPYAMAKIDVEGLELSVLKGATQMLSNQNPPVVILEINGSSERYMNSASDIVNYISKYGYEPAKYDAKTNSLKNLSNQEAWGDVLFIHKELRDFVVERISSH